MRKVFLMTLLLVIAFTLMGGVALAGGWTTIDYTQSHDPDSDIPAVNAQPENDPFNAIWNPDEAAADADNGNKRSPHGFFSATSNKCRVCHAVHMAGTGSWRLLRSGDSKSINAWGPEQRGMDRASECNFCHGMTGATQKRPFRPKAYDVMGEHTIGSTQIPDSTVTTTIADGLSCGNCHTVHGSGDLPSYGGGIKTEADANNTWTDKILKNDPNGDDGKTGGGKLAQGSNVLGAASDANMVDDAWATLSNFCADCHNVNPNWDTDAADDTDPDAVRPNARSHAQGPAAQGSLEVYGATETVAGWGTLAAGYGNDVSGYDPATTEDVDQTPERGCRGCHAAENSGNRDAGVVWDATGTVAEGSAWPHQSQGSKLLFDTFQEGTTQTAGGSWFDTNNPANPNDALRVLPGMDKLCMRCHRSDSGVDMVTNDGSIDGVGRSF